LQVVLTGTPDADGVGPHVITSIVARPQRPLPNERSGITLRAMDMPVSPLDLLRWSEALAGVARTGLGFTESLYERERFEEVLKVATDIRAAAVEEAESDALFEEWLDSIGEGVAGYVTPKVAVAAVVGNGQGEILLTQRA